MVSNCAAPIKGTHLRLVKVDTCGNPVTGTNSLVVVTKGFVQVVQEPQYEDGEEFFERTADGSVCVNQKDDPTLKRMQLTVDWCEVNVSAMAYVLSARELTLGTSPTTGYGFVISEGQPTNRFSMEVWQRVAGSGACDPSGLQRYVYNAWPNIGSVQLGTYTIENGRSTLQFIGQTAGAGTQWGDGPGTGTSWLPVGAPVMGSADHWAWNITTNAPPTPACNPTTLT
jgi:hypothetical protein